MHLFDVIKLQEPSFDPVNAKVHLARKDQKDKPMDLYKRGKFDEWQRRQKKLSFNLPLVVSLIQDGSSNRWMFAGLFKNQNYTLETGHPKGRFKYKLERFVSTADLEGRLFCTSAYTSRNSYVYSKTVADMTVVELLAERISVGAFPGYKQVNLSKDELDLLVRNNTESWRAALSSVKGIYLITDTKTGKLYVGKADGATGIWGRWGQYSSSGHGHNKALVEEQGLKASERQRDLHFSLLEIADLQSAPGEIERRESHWKDILMTRTTGYNRN